MKKYLFFVLLFSLLFIIIATSYYKTENFENISNSVTESNSETNLENKISLLGIFKNETMGLKLWIEHYIKQGVEKFYLIDNDSNDNPLEILQSYIDEGIVKYFFLPEKGQQLEHYMRVFDSEQLADKTKWLIICDLDEFYYGVPNNLSITIDEFDDYDLIYSNHRNFGTDGLEKHPENILKSILYREDNLGGDTFTKYIFKPKALNNLNDIKVHKVENIDNYVNENDKIRLNHYPIQSLEYFQKVKMTRGDVYHSYNARDMSYFNQLLKDKTTEDRVLADMQD
jgi:hypothetical protein